MNNEEKSAKHSVKVEQKIIDKIKESTNILVTLSRNPTVDALASALGLTLLLDKMGKHATTVFSGEIPAVLNFLEPEKTFENTVESLRDFIISLDKEKADRLRLKTEGDFVQVLITPYKTKISKDDLKFKEGEFNVEFVLAIGINNNKDLDSAIAAHGQILHNAIVATINLNENQDHVGNLTWQNATESATFSEMSLNLAKMLESNAKKSLIDEKIATAFLTGLVAATDQFRNHKTTPNVMKISAELMAKGANQQLIASELSASEMNLTEPILGAEEENSENNFAKNDDSSEIAQFQKSLEQENDKKAVSIKNEVEIENAKIAESQAKNTREIIESQLTNNDKKIDSTNSAAEIALDQIAQNSQKLTDSDALTELKNLAEQTANQENSETLGELSGNFAEKSQQTTEKVAPNFENQTTNTSGISANSTQNQSVNNAANPSAEQNREEKYLGSPLGSPMDSATFDDEPPSIDPFAPPKENSNSSPNLVGKNSTLKFGEINSENFNQLKTANSAAENLPPAPELPLPPLGQMPMINSAPNNQAQITDLPPVPPITNPNSTDDLASQAAALAESAQKIAENTQNPTSFANNSADMSNPAINSGNGEISQNPKPEEKPEPNFPEATTPPSDPNDPTQFHIPGQN